MGSGVGPAAGREPGRLCPYWALVQCWAACSGRASAYRETSIVACSSGRNQSLLEVCSVIIKEQQIAPGRGALLTRNSPRLRLSISVRAAEPWVQASCAGSHGHAGAVGELGFTSRWAQSHGADPELLTGRHIGVSLLPAVPWVLPAAQPPHLSSARPAGETASAKRLLGKFLSKRAAAKFSILYF